jgi:hypothetical protein
MTNTEENNVVPIHKPERDRLVCVACFASVEVTCDCGAEHKRMTKRELAKLAVEKNPDMSNRAIAKFINVSDVTVFEARKALTTANHLAVGEERIGLDGKVRTLPKKNLPSQIVIDYIAANPDKSHGEIAQDLGIREYVVQQMRDNGTVNQRHSCSINPVPLPQSLQESRVNHAMGYLKGLSYSDLKVMAHRIQMEEPQLWLRLQKIISKS